MNNEFQYRLQKCLNENKINAAELARVSGVSKAAISNYINGKYIPKQKTCYLFAKTLNVDPGWLMTGFESVSPKLNDKDAYDIIDLYISLNEEHRTAAKNYLQFLKAQEDDNG